MDPLTIGFEDAFHDANLALEADPRAAANLVSALRAVIEASPHRSRGAVTVSAVGPTRVELRRGEKTYLLDNASGQWRLVDSHASACSGPVAAALTEWLTT